jgi:HSP20 family protein
MTNISVRKDAPTTPTTTPRAPEWEGSRLMRSLLGWDPFREMAPDYGGRLLAPESDYLPAFDVKETNEGFQFHADVPGLLEKDLQITVNGNRLSVSGKRDREEKKQTDTYYAYERSYGSFTRSFVLPAGADVAGAKAELKDGVLNLFVPKRPEQQPKNIEIKKV